MDLKQFEYFVRVAFGLPPTAAEVIAAAFNRNFQRPKNLPEFRYPVSVFAEQRQQAFVPVEM